MYKLLYMGKVYIYNHIYTFTWIFELGLAKKSAHSTTWQFKTTKNHFIARHFFDKKDAENFA